MPHHCSHCITFTLNFINQNRMKKTKNDNKKTKPVEKVSGLYQFCPVCRAWVNGRNGFTCSHSNWYFRCVIRDKATGKIRSKILKTKDRDEAIRELIAFKKIVESTPATSTNPKFIIVDEISDFREFLQKKNYTKKYINDQMRFITWFSEWIKSEGGKVNTDISQLQSEDVKRFIIHLKEKSIAEATIKNAINRLANWFSYMAEVRKLPINNPWK